MVDHQILLKKLHCLALNSNSMEWFKSLWSWTGHLNRKLSLVFEASHSRGAPRKHTWTTTVHHMRQWSTSVSQVLKDHSLRWLYVNLLFCQINCEDVQTFLNKDLESASLWLQSNLLTLNCSKSRFLLFGSKRTCQKNQAPSTTTRSVDTLSFCNTSSFWLRCHYLGEQKQCYRNERSSNSTKQGS